jgi:hypothetical protein
MFNQLCGAALGLLAFSVSLIIGLYVDNPFITVVQRSILALIIFYILGCVLSVLGQKVIQENFNNQVVKKASGTAENSKKE